MPLCWSSKSMFRRKDAGENSTNYTLDLESSFTSFYKYEKGTDEDLLKILADMRKPEKVSRLTLVPGVIKVSLEKIGSGFVQDLNKKESPDSSHVVITEFPYQSVEPFRQFTHLLYVYPIVLNLTSVTSKIRARNILCRVFLRAEDDIDASRELELKWIRAVTKNEELINSI